MRFYVYVLKRESDDVVIYVGKGTGRRMDMHAGFAGPWATKNQRGLYAKLKALRDGGDDFYAEKVFQSDDEGEVLRKEIDVINSYGLDNLYNGVSASVFGITNSQKAQAVRDAISKARTGMKFSDEHRANIRKANLAKPPRTAEHRRNQSLGQTGIKHKKHSNALPPDVKRERVLAMHKRQYQKRRESELARLQTERDADRQKRWQAELTRRGLPLDTPMPRIIGPLAAYSPEQRLVRKRAREKLNHRLRRARAAGDATELARLEVERRKLDEAVRVVEALLEDCSAVEDQ